MSIPIGSIIKGRYRIESILGLGGFGAVYRAWDIYQKKDCALKENLDTSGESQRQFSREATILARLWHPNLPRVSDHFIYPGVGQYLVMDFVDGDDLEVMLERRGPLPIEKSLDWISQIAGALDYLHTSYPPIFHRDIKPANIKITPAGKAVLVDFGLVKMSDPTSRTTVGARAVTPGYAPPEQYGKGRTDGRTDIYALGGTLYTMLTGQEPPESVDRTTGVLLMPPSDVNPIITKKTEAVILRAMQIAPKDRYQTAAAFKKALDDALIALQPPKVSPAGWPYSHPGRSSNTTKPSRPKKPANQSTPGNFRMMSESVVIALLILFVLCVVIPGCVTFLILLPP
jgi:serine/threonine-protein kinase